MPRKFIPVCTAYAGILRWFGIVSDQQQRSVRQQAAAGVSLKFRAVLLPNQRALRIDFHNNSLIGLAARCAAGFRTVEYAVFAVLQAAVQDQIFRIVRRPDGLPIAIQLFDHGLRFGGRTIFRTVVRMADQQHSLIIRNDSVKPHFQFGTRRAPLLKSARVDPFYVAASGIIGIALILQCHDRFIIQPVRGIVLRRVRQIRFLMLPQNLTIQPHQHHLCHTELFGFHRVLARNEDRFIAPFFHAQRPEWIFRVCVFLRLVLNRLYFSRSCFCKGKA